MKKLNELFPEADSDVEIKAIKINSKEVEKGDLFVCTMGVTADRHDFIDDAWILLFSLLHGPMHHFDEAMSTWRYVAKDDGGNWNSLNRKRNQYMQETYFHVAQMYWLEQYRKPDKRERERAWYDFRLGTSVFVKHPSAGSWRLFVTVLKYDLLHMICRLPKPGLTENTGGWAPQYIPEAEEL